MPIYNVKENEYPAQSRSERRRKAGQGSSGASGSVTIVSGPGGTPVIPDHDQLSGITSTADQYPETAKGIHLTASDADKLKTLLTAILSVIKSTDVESIASDDNIFTALRTLNEISKALAKNVENTDQRYLRKDIADSAEDDITFKKDIIVDNLTKTFKLTVEELSILAKAIVDEIGSTKFVDGMFGEGFQLWMDKLTGLSNLTIDKVTIRQSLVAMELLIEKVRSVGGQFIVSAANGKIKTGMSIP